MDAVDAALLNERVRPLKRSEYDRLVELGVFEDERVELLYGRIVAMSPQSGRHAWTVTQVVEWLVLALHQRATVRTQVPIAAGDEHEPEPDVAVVDRHVKSADHPSAAHLLVEIADSSRQRDLGIKAAIYAAMGVRDYWVIDLQRREIVIHRDPAGDGYRQIVTYGEDATIAPLAFPDVQTRLADLLPPA